jgi:hypothetical protein
MSERPTIGGRFGASIVIGAAVLIAGLGYTLVGLNAHARSQLSKGFAARASFAANTTRGLIATSTTEQAGSGRQSSPDRRAGSPPDSPLTVTAHRRTNRRSCSTGTARYSRNSSRQRQWRE